MPYPPLKSHSHSHPHLPPTLPLTSRDPSAPSPHPLQNKQPPGWPSSPRHRNPSIRQQTDLISPPAFLPSPPLCFHHRRAPVRTVTFLRFGADAGGQVFLGLGLVLGLWCSLMGVGRGRGRGREGGGKGEGGGDGYLQLSCRIGARGGKGLRVSFVLCEDWVLLCCWWTVL